jgi:dihydrofolate reductase
MEVKNKYTLIACANKKWAIGKDNGLMYHIHIDMMNFKSLTTDNVVIMGRKTFESLPGKKPLKNRINIIITSQEDYQVAPDNWTTDDINNTYFANSLEDADLLCEAFFSDKELFIIGGGQIYEKAYELGMVNKAIITYVNDESEGDTYLHNYDEDDNYKIIFRTASLRDHALQIYYRYIVYLKK